MPVSKRRPKRHGAAKQSPPPARVPRRRSDWKRRVGWTMVAVGGVMFLLGNIGARTGIVFLPFDPHHVIGQLGGGLVAVVGLMVATS